MSEKITIKFTESKEAFRLVARPRSGWLGVIGRRFGWILMGWVTEYWTE